MNAILRPVGHFFFERQGRGKTPTQLADELEKSHQTLVARIQAAPQTEANHGVVTHIIGIERWSQRRVQVVQGAAFHEEEYNGHRPPRNTSWDDLKTMFEQTRRVTITLARSLSQTQLTQKVRHNTYGEMTAAGWLAYINFHSNLESRRLR